LNISVHKTSSFSAGSVDLKKFRRNHLLGYHFGAELAFHILGLWTSRGHFGCCLLNFLPAVYKWP